MSESLKVSNCCGSYGLQIISVPEIIQAKDAGICGKCGEHCEYVDEDEPIKEYFASRDDAYEDFKLNNPL